MGYDKDGLQKAAQALADGQLDELMGEASSADPFPSAKALAAPKTFPKYHPETLVQLFVEHPEWSHKQFADHFGHRPSWFSSALISTPVQAIIARRKHEILNPLLSGDMKLWFQALTVQALSVIQTRMEDPKASEELILKAAALGVKALGMGQTNPMSLAPPPAPESLSSLAAGLMAGTPTVDTNADAEEVEVHEIAEPTRSLDRSIEHALESPVLPDEPSAQ